MEVKGLLEVTMAFPSCFERSSGGVSRGSEEFDATVFVEDLAGELASRSNASVAKFAMKEIQK